MSDACFAVTEVTKFQNKEKFRIRSRFIYHGTSLQFQRKNQNKIINNGDDAGDMSKVEKPVIRKVPSVFNHESSGPPNEYQWVPVEHSLLTESSGNHTYVLDQFIPARVKELVIPEDSVLESARADEVGLQGTLTLYINNFTRLIRRMDFFISTVAYP